MLPLSYLLMNKLKIITKKLIHGLTGAFYLNYLLEKHHLYKIQIAKIWKK